MKLARVISFSFALLLGSSPFSWSEEATRTLSLSLTQAQILLEKSNREIIAARLALEVAGSQVLLAGARPNPTLGAQISSISPSRGLGAGSLQNKQMDSILSINQLVERGSKRELRISTADAQVLAAQRDLTEIRRQQQLALGLAYFELKLALERLRILQDTAQLQEQAVTAAKRRLAAGDAAESEVIRLSLEALRASNDARTAQADVSRARQSLGLLFGADGKAEQWVASDDWPDHVAAQSMAAPDPARIASRADVRAAQARVAASEKNRELARQLRTRDVTVGAQIERFPPDAGVSYGISMSIPLFSNYHFEGEIAQAEAELTSAMAARDRQLMIAMSDVTRAQTDLMATAERRHRLADELLPQARRALASAEFAYQHGATGLLDLLDARRTLRAVELDAATAAADFAKAHVAWRAAQSSELESP